MASTPKTIGVPIRIPLYVQNAMSGEYDEIAVVETTAWVTVELEVPRG